MNNTSKIIKSITEGFKEFGGMENIIFTCRGFVPGTLEIWVKSLKKVNLRTIKGHKSDFSKVTLEMDSLEDVNKLKNLINKKVKDSQICDIINILDI